MICVDYPCDNCIHKRANIDGWKCACDAYPEGIPTEVILYTDVSKTKECNNNIGYESKNKAPSI